MSRPVKRAPHAEVLAAGRAVPALAARPAEPRDADPRAGLELGARRRPRARVPTIWWPGISGYRLGRQLAVEMCRSVRQTPQAWTSTSASPGPGSRSAGRQDRAAAGRRGRRGPSRAPGHHLPSERHGRAHRHLRPRAPAAVVGRGAPADARPAPRRLRLRRRALRGRARARRRDARHLPHDRRRLRAAPALRRRPHRAVHALPRGRRAGDLGRRARGRTSPAAARSSRAPTCTTRSSTCAAWANDAFALALPVPVVCTPECAGLCPECGANLNTAGAEHRHEAAPDPRWAKLRELRFD